MHRTHALACLALLAAPMAFAQPAGSAGAHGPMDHKQMHGMEGGGMGIVPPGTWWRNPATITGLTLTADQQKKLDDLFLQSRIGLIHLHASLEEEQLKLEPLLNSSSLDQVKTLAEISKIADLRADLEKANAKMLLSLRGVLTADQWTRMQAYQHARMDRERNEHGSKLEADQHAGQDHERGPKRGPGGQGAPQGQTPNVKGSGAPPPPAGPTE